MKIVELTNVDFSMRHFLLPLMRGIRARGHEVVGICADGPLLAEIRAEGFRVEPAPFVRRLSPAGAMASLPRPGETAPPGTPGPRPRPHAHQRLPRPPRRPRRRGPTRRLYVPRLPVQPARPAAPPRCRLPHGMARRPHDRTASSPSPTKKLATPAASASPAMPPASAMAATRRVFHPDPEARHRIRTSLGVSDDIIVIIAVSRLVRHKGYPELLAALPDLSRAPNSGSSANASPPTMARTSPRISTKLPKPAASAASATGRTSPPCSPPPTSSPCPAISRACPCRSSKPCSRGSPSSPPT